MGARRSRRLAPVVVVAVAIMLAPMQPAIAANGAWDDPVVVGEAALPASSARVVADGSTLVATWLIGTAPNFEVVASRSTDGLTWSPLAFLSAPAPMLADTQLVSGGGRVTTAWLQQIDDVYRVQVATSSTGGATWSSATTISPAGESVDKVRLVSDGSTIIATWSSQSGPDRRIRVATSSNGSSWGASVQLDLADDARDPVAIIDGSTAVVAWASFDDANFILESSVSTTAGSSWSTPTALPSIGGVRPELVFDGSRLTAVYPTFEGSLISRSSTDLGQTWPDVAVITSGLDGESYQLDVVGEGENLTAIWWVNGAPDFVQVASSFNGGATWTTPQQLSTGGATFSTPQLAIDGERRVAVWRQSDGSNRRVVVTTSDNGGVDWGFVETLSVAGGEAAAPQIVMRGATITVMWGLAVASEAAVQATSFTTPPSVRRLAGADRYRTAVEISKEFDPGVPVVYLATGADYPDALSAASAAASQGGPLLLTTPNTLPAVVEAELQRLNPTLVVIAGGPSVVSATVLQQVEAALPSAIVRRDSGANRYETSRIIAERAFATATTAFVATGLNFPDALSASAAAGGLDAPVILVNGNATTLDAPTLTLLDDLGVETVTVVGGTSVVSSGIENIVKTTLGSANVNRLSGSDRYATSLAINAEFFAEADTVYLATGRGFADALAGAALAGGTPGPLFVVPGTCVPSGMVDRIGLLGATEVVLFGGTSVLTPAVESLTRC